MSGIKDYERILEDTPYVIPYDLHKNISIPILKDDYTFSEDCKEIGKQLLQNTKRPLCQNLDVIIPERERSGLFKRDVESFKNFIGKRMFKEDEHMTDNKSNGRKTPKMDTKKETITPSMNSAALKEIRELIKTEESYVQTLQDIVQKIIKPIKSTLKTKSPMLDRFLFNNIFINIEQICDVNTAFYDELKKYNEKSTEAMLGSICKKYMAKMMNLYKTFLLKMGDCDLHHTKALKKRNAYNDFVLNNELFQVQTLTDILAPIVQRMTKYDLMFNNIIKNLSSKDPDAAHFEEALAKVVDICSMEYGPNAKGSELIYFFTLIKNSPYRFLNDKRKLLYYFDCTEMSMSNGRKERAVTILVFNDKLMVAKRKNHDVSSQECFEKLKQKFNSETSTSPLKKLVDFCTGTSLEFKGWVDIKSTEIFDGLKDRPDTFLIRTSLPDLAEDDTEAEYEDYFRRSDRLYSVAPRGGFIADKTQEYKVQRQKLISLYQQQFALLNCTDENEVFHESNFALPAYAYIYNEKSYKKSNFKNNILAIYVEDGYQIDLESLLTDDVWALILIRKEARGFKGVVRSKVSMTPLREPREMEYETIVDSNQNMNGKYDFFTTLWNSVIYYERRLRASTDYSNLHDTRLRERARSRSRSKSLSRAASRVFGSRSRSTSPSRSLNTENSTISTTNTFKSITNNNSGTSLYRDPPVNDPILKVASVNKPPLFTDEMMMHKQDTLSSFEDFVAHMNSDDNNYQPRNASVYRNSPTAPPFDTYRRESFDFNSIDNNAGSFIDQFNDPIRRRPEESLYSGCNIHQDNSRRNSYSRNLYHSNNNRPSTINTNRPSYDMEYYTRPTMDPVSRPGSGGGNSSSSATSDSPTSISTMSNDMAAMCGNINNFRSNSMHDYDRADYFENYSNNSINEENLLQSLDKFQSMHSTKRTSTHQRPSIPPQYYRRTVLDQLNQLKLEFNSTIDNIIHQHQQMSSNCITPEDVRGLRSHFMSRLDDLSNNTQKYRSYR